MSQHHFDIVILGDSLASRLAGVLLSREGVRVLTFQGNNRPVGLWFRSSLLLERILDNFGGRSCFTAPLPFQVLDRGVRIEFNGSFPLEEEIRREFPTVHLEVLRVLQQLAGLAERLENRLWNSGSLPLFGLGSRLAFWSRLGSGLSHRSLGQPLPTLFAGLAGAPAEVLKALFAGLAQAPADSLTIGEGALLWAGTVRDRAISPSGLDALLRHRYEQFNGEMEDLVQVHSLSAQGDRLNAVLLKGEGRFSADNFLLGSPEIFPLLPEEWRKHLPRPALPTVFSATFAEAAVPPPLAPRAILAGTPPLRLSLVNRDGQVQCSAITYRTEGEPQLPAEAIDARLAGLFPFSPPSFRLRQEGVPVPRQLRSGYLGATGNLRLRGNVFLCHGPCVFPTLGTTGEILAGYAIARRLLKTVRRK